MWNVRTQFSTTLVTGGENFDFVRPTYPLLKRKKMTKKCTFYFPFWSRPLLSYLNLEVMIMKRLKMDEESFCVASHRIVLASHRIFRPSSKKLFGLADDHEEDEEKFHKEEKEEGISWENRYK